MTRTLALSIGLIFFPSLALSAGEANEKKIDFLRKIQPILAKHCYECHGPEEQEGGLRLDRKEAVFVGGDSGAVLLAGQGNKSPLIQRIKSSDESEQMPPEGPRLLPEQILLIQTWVDQGSIWPETKTESTEDPGKAAGSHWAFQKPRRPPLPQIQKKSWVRNPIDRFVLARLEQKGRQPSPAASPGALLRRMYLDVIGLPPTLAEQDQIDDGSSAESFDRIVDQLLLRPEYGERWARHWLDLVRYADSNGYERDAAKPFVWRYRDYVIRAFNQDMPYDRFLTEQLAGDELPEADTQTVIATGYYRLGSWDDEPADPLMDRYDQLDEIIRTTSQALLGLTLGCARCHNHKFEPLTTRDYYNLMAVFDPLQRPKPGRADISLPAGSPARVRQKEIADRQVSQLQKETKQLRDVVKKRVINAEASKLTDQHRQALVLAPEKLSETQKKLLVDQAALLEAEISQALSDEEKQQLSRWQEKIRSLQDQHALPQGYFLVEKSPKPAATHLLVRGNPTRPGIEVLPGVPAVLVSEQPEFLPTGPFTSRRRLSLARWLASSDNPLTARVIVNRVWLHHFGQGLVRSPSDFGVRGQSPTHPQLLDWLADWFVNEGQWSLKRLHRLIMTSNSYRMSKKTNARYAAEDPQNLLLWRFPYRRLEVEAIRDSMLHVSGQLRKQMYGPSTFPFLPKAATEGHSDPDAIWEAFDEDQASRRTIYAFVKRSLLLPILEVLDFCDTTQSSPGRRVTTVAPQALTLFNGNFVNRQSRHFATRLAQEAGTQPKQQIELAYRLALCRLPSTTEQSTMLSFLQQEAAKLVGESTKKRQTLSPDSAHRQALEQMCRVIFNLNEFSYTD